MEEQNAFVRERFELTVERLRLMAKEETVAQPFCGYFQSMADFCLLTAKTGEELERGEDRNWSLEKLQEKNRSLYCDILPGAYENSYANPARAAETLGEEFGRLLSFFAAELRGQIVFAYEGRLEEMTILNETLIEIYNMFEAAARDGHLPAVSEIRDVLYWFTSDYCDLTVDYRVREGLDPGLSFAADIIMKEDLSDLRYLYRFGEYISETELEVAAFLNSLPEETVRLMADTYTEGYRKGFEVMRRNLSSKKTVMIRYPLGFERMIRQAVLNFRAMGLEPIFCRTAVWSVNRTPGRRVGYGSSSPNKQYDYDHRYDSALYINGAFQERRLAMLRVAYETYRELAAVYAGPAVVETFGEPGFVPVNCPQCWSYTEKQESLAREYQSGAAQLANRYIPGDETSFTIIAFPVPAIGPEFREIFREIIRINTLDYEKYRNIQQSLIDALDTAEYAEITGGPGNETSLRVQLHRLQNPAKESNFENCVADVNIPVGEVFTSPVLAGTSGLLHVKNVYIGEFQFVNLRLRFQDGMVTDYGCENFESEEESRALVRQVILKNHDTLPMGEFAIGTNTAAYAAAQKYGIMEKLPILIAEKTGPHFAVGDTCYSWSEDTPVYNPDGKELIARDNEISILRKEDLSRAYFNCHTDITIPYGELGRIEAVAEDGGRTLLIDGGRFVLEGTEELNKPLT